MQAQQKGNIEECCGSNLVPKHELPKTLHNKVTLDPYPNTMP